MAKEYVGKYKYKCELIYVNNKKNKIKTIEKESIKSFVIDHNYEKLNMPVIYITLSLDKTLIDDMIKNQNDNLFNFTVWKFNELSDDKLNVIYFKDEFIYFLPDNLNSNNDIDYVNDDQKAETYNKTVTMGLMCKNHINNNKKSISMSIRNTNKYDCVKYVTSHMKNVLIEPFNYNETYDQLIIPSIDSVSKTLAYLNDNDVFYKTPFRYYIDFDNVFIISSSGKAILRKNDIFESVIIDIKDIIDAEANDPGIVVNKSKGNHKVVVSYPDTTVYDNSISNKTLTEIKGYDESGSTRITLNSSSTNSTTKTKSIRASKNKLENIVNDINSSNVFVSIMKEDLDTSVFTINKRYSINHIDRYKNHNGNYLITRKQEAYYREDNEQYTMALTVNFRKLG